jgi:hypothetical protein
MTQQARLFQRMGSLRPRRHLARFFQGIYRSGILAAAVRRKLHFLFRHCARPYVGGFNSPASQPRISGCIGSCDTLIA